MRRHLCLVVVCFFCVIVSTFVAAQEATSIPPGDASLAGRVIDADSQRPLEGAMVTLTSFDRKGVLKALSDANGRYVFEGIAPNGYLVSVFLEGYGSQEYASSGTVHGRPDIVAVPQRRATTGVNFLLRRAGSIMGQVTLSGGQPVKDALVTVISAPDDRSVFITSRASSSRTDNDGVYTITNVPPGSYWVAAAFDPELMKARGEPHLNRTYFPGAQTLAEAAPVRVGVRETVRRINIQLISREYLRLSGHVLRGQSEGAVEANLVSRGWSVRPIQVAEDGAFDITYLEPGRYTFWARARTPDGDEAAIITVDLETDMTGLPMPLLPAGGVSGRVVTDDGTPLPAGLRVAAVQADDGKQIDPLERDRVDVTEGGRFDLRGLFGERILRVLGLTPEWTVDRVLRRKDAVQSLSIAAGEQTDEIMIVLKRR